MGRPLRIDAPGCWHHVMNRGAGRRIVFRDDCERIGFVNLLSELEERFGIEIHAFCLMGNHYHLLVRSRDGRISEAMKWLGARFTLATNAGRSVDGAIFRGRFHSVILEHESHLTWLYRYINANPIELGWDRRLAAYPWSGLAATLGERSDQNWLRTDFAENRFGGDAGRIERFVESARRERMAPLVALPASEREVVGAIEVARRPGPDVASNAQVRAAHTLIARRLGIGDDGIETISHLPEHGRTQYIDRATAAADGDPLLAALIRRAESVLAFHHSVSDTIW